MSNSYFDKFVGQETVKETLSMYLDAYNNGRVVPHILAIAPKGVGKTVFCRKFQDYMGRKEIMEINGSEMKSPKQVVENLFGQIQGIEASVFIDEIHMMSSAVQNMFLTVLNPEPEHKTSLTFEGIKYEFDFKNKLTFLFATTERQLIFAPLLDRMQEVSFDDYKPDELCKILALNTKDLDLKDEALKELVKFSRGNARWAQKTGENLASFCSAKGIKEVTPDIIPQFNKVMGIFEYGLTKQELNVLRSISEFSQGATLTMMCSLTGNTRAAQMDMEKYLQKNGLMIIDGKRKITQKGKELLQRIK